MFRRRGILAIVLCLLLALSPAALAAEGDTTLFEQGSSGYSETGVEAAVAIGDTLYVMTWTDLYTYKLGDAEPTKLMPLQKEYVPPVESADATPAPVESLDGAAADLPVEYNWNDRLALPFAYQGKLHMINQSSYKVFALEGDAFVDTGMKFEPPSGTENYGLSGVFVTIFEFEDKLYALTRVDMDNWDAPMELWVVDPATGGHTTIKTELPLKGVCGYEPGKLLGWTQPEWGSIPGDYKESDYYSTMFVLDAATGKTLNGPVVVGAQAWSNVCGPLYDPADGMIYYAIQNRLLRQNGFDAEPEVMSYFSRELYQTASSITVLSGTHLVIPTYEGTYIRNMKADPTTSKPVRIANYYMSEPSSAFMRDNPDIPLEFVSLDSVYRASADEIAKMIGSGEDSIDIYMLSSGPQLLQLIEKGYAQDLSGSETIMRALERMYEPIRDALTVDGKPMCFPHYVSADLWSYNKEKFEELGLEYPQTYSEFIDLKMKWEDEFRDDDSSTHFNSDYKQSDGAFKMQMFSAVLNQYMKEFSKPNEPIRFSTPELMEVLRKVEALPGEFDYGDNSNSYEYDENTTFLLEQYYNLESYSSDGGVNTPALPPRISLDSDPGISFYCSVFVVNPNSANVANAIKFIEYLTEHNEHSMMIAMYPDFNEPLKEAWAVRDLANAEEYLEKAKEEAAKATEETKRDTEEMVKDAEKWVKEAESRLWRIKKETIEEYRALIDSGRLYLDTTSNFFGSDSAAKELQDLLLRYFGGQISLDQMVREFDQKMQMIFLEQQ